MKHVVSILTLGAALVSSFAYGQKDVTKEKVKSVHFSEGCGPVDYQAISYGEQMDPEDGVVMFDSLEVSFADFSALIDTPGIISSDCYVQVEVRVPAGKQFRADAAYVQGTYSLSNRAEADFYIDYKLYDAKARRVLGPNSPEPLSVGLCDVHGKTGFDDFTLKAPDLNRKFTECKDYPSVVTLVTNINGTIRSKGYDLSEIIFDQFDNDTSTKHGKPEFRPGLTWDWNWMECPELSMFEGGEFIASRSTKSGRLEDAHVTIKGNKGYFITKNGEGQLYDIKFYDDGYVAEGRWSLGRHTGTFVFEIDYHDDNLFKGTYHNEKTGYRGQWKGYR